VSKISVNLERRDRPKKEPRPLKEPKVRERKPVHPGLLKMGITLRCSKCEGFLGFSEKRVAMLEVAACECGLWLMNEKRQVRWVRWTSELFMPSTGPIFSSER
jgi:hypothetical protein